MVPATILVNGFVRGTWRIEKSRRNATLVIRPFESLYKQDRDSLSIEGEQLVSFVEGGVKIHDIRFVE
ncbi:MAG: DNA glycosylase AlkZ-like family protein, partial [Rubrobacteraceae bacterium]